MEMEPSLGSIHAAKVVSSTKENCLHPKAFKMALSFFVLEGFSMTNADNLKLIIIGFLLE